MASVNKTKVRLQQLSGSAGDVFDASAVTASKVSFSDSGFAMVDLGDMLKEYGRAIARISGKSDFTNNDRGLIDHDAGDIVLRGSDSNDAQKILLDQRDTTGGEALKLELDFDGSDDTNNKATLEVLRGTGEDAIKFAAAAGGVDVDAAAGKDLDLAGGQVKLSSKDNAAGAISVLTNVGSTETITVLNTQGAAAGAIDIQSQAGGMTLKVADTKSLKMGNTDLDAVFEVAASSVAGDELVKVLNTSGTDEAAVSVQANAGGIDIDAAAAKNVDIAGGQVFLTSKDDAADAIKLLTDIGSTESITVKNTRGTAAAAVKLEATAGGLDLDAAAAKFVDIAGGKVLIKNKDDATDAIVLEADVGTSEQIKLDVKQGTSDVSIDIGSFAGGVLVAGGKANADAVVLEANASDSRVVAKVNGNEVLRIADKSGRMTQNEASFELGSGQELALVHDFGSAAGYHQVKSSERLHLSGSGNASLSGALVQISGSHGLGFVGGGIGKDAGSSFAFSGYNDTAGALLLSDLSSATLYKTNFGSTTILGAINDVFSRVTSGVEPTLMQKTITSASINQETAVGIYPGDGTDTSGGGTPAFFSTGPMSEIKPQKVDVFVNGQMLMSGSLTEMQGGTVDYHVSAPGEIQFAFALRKDDVLKVIDRT